MQIGDSVEDVTKGGSLGMEYIFRRIRDGKDFAIYNTETGKIVEIIDSSENPIYNDKESIKRLYEINGVKQELDDDMRDLLDTTS